MTAPSRVRATRRRMPAVLTAAVVASGCTVQVPAPSATAHPATTARVAGAVPTTLARRSPGCGHAPPAPAGSDRTYTVAVDPSLSAGVSQRTALVHVPATYSASMAAPLVMEFHGAAPNATSRSYEMSSPLHRLSDSVRIHRRLPAGAARAERQSRLERVRSRVLAGRRDTVRGSSACHRRSRLLRGRDACVRQRGLQRRQHGQLRGLPRRRPLRRDRACGGSDVRAGRRAVPAVARHTHHRHPQPQRRRDFPTQATRAGRTTTSRSPRFLRGCRAGRGSTAAPRRRRAFSSQRPCSVEPGRTATAVPRSSPTRRRRATRGRRLWEASPQHLWCGGS